MSVQKKVRVGCLENCDDPITSQLYRKIVQPSLYSVHVQTHPNRHGVEIHSTFVPQKKNCSMYISHIKQQEILKSDERIKQSRSFPDINNSKQVHKAVFLPNSAQFPPLVRSSTGFRKSRPLSTGQIYLESLERHHLRKMGIMFEEKINSRFQYQHVHSEVNFQRSTTSQSFSSSKTMVKQGPFPSVKGTINERALSPRNSRSFTIAGEKYLGSTKSIPKHRSLSAGRLPKSEQEKRFAKEQMELDKTRSMKRMSETMSHRIDRLYYMRGSVIKPMHRYSVDNKELVQLKEMSRARSSSRRSRNGSSCYGKQSATPPLPHSQENYKGGITGEEGTTHKFDSASPTNRSHSAGSKESSDRGHPSEAELIEGQSAHATFSEASRNDNYHGLVADENVRSKVRLEYAEEIGEPWAEVAQKVENVDKNGRVSSSKQISDPINIIDKDYKSASEEIFLTQFEDPKVEKDLLCKENVNGEERTDIEGDIDSDGDDRSNASQRNRASRRNKILKSKDNKEKTDNEGDIDSGGDDKGKGHIAGSQKTVSECGTDFEDEGYNMNTNDEEIKNMEDGIRKFDLVASRMGNIGHLEGSDISLDDKTEEIYDSGVFSKPKSEEEIKAALARREKKRQEKEEKKRQAEEERQKRTMPQEEKAAILANVYNFISPRQQKVFEDKFEELDVDGNGVLILDELKKRMKKWVAKEDVHLILQIFDLNKDKTIDIREFVTIAALNDKITGHVTESSDQPLNFNLKKLSHHVTSYKEMFDVMDVNSNGQLSMDELMIIVVASTGLDIQADQDVVKYIYDTIDKDKSGFIDFVEYLSYIPFFLKLYKHVFGKPVSLDAIEEALQSVKQHKCDSTS